MSILRLSSKIASRFAIIKLKDHEFATRSHFLASKIFNLSPDVTFETKYHELTARCHFLGLTIKTLPLDVTF